MTCQQAFNSFGLLLDIFGVAIIFIWGPPQPVLETGVALGLEDNTPLPGQGGKTVVEYNREVERLRERHSCMSRIGLVLILLGFLLQLVSAWVR